MVRRVTNPGFSCNTRYMRCFVALGTENAASGVMSCTHSQKPARSGRRHFITGATGFVGAPLLLELLRVHPLDRAFCLVRANSPQHARHRITTALLHAAAACDLPDSELDSILARTIAICGDLCAADLCLDERDRDRLAAGAPLVVWHCATSRHSEEALHELVARNVTSTEKLLETLLTVDIATFNHVSTAYVAGRQAGLVPETSNRPRGFRNRYEQSKYYGEMAVVDHCVRARVPYRILRPSIIISNSRTGRATGYASGLEWVLKVKDLAEMSGDALRNHKLKTVARADAELNWIPIDSFVEDCIGIDAAGAKTHDRVFHLTNTASPTVEWICNVTARTLGIKGIEIVADANTLDPLSAQFHARTGFERPYCLARQSFSREESNPLYDSPRHGNCQLTEELVENMIHSAVCDHRRQAAAHRGAA